MQVKEISNHPPYTLSDRKRAAFRRHQVSMDVMTAPATPISPHVDAPYQAQQAAPDLATRFQPYPGVAYFSTSFGYRDFLQTVAGLRTRGSRGALGLSLRLPDFEARRQLRGQTQPAARRATSATYLGYLKRECALQGQLFSGMNRIEHLRWHGVGATTLSGAQIGSLMQHLRQWFQFAPDAIGEQAIEVDAVRVTTQQIEALRRAGFNHAQVVLDNFDWQRTDQPDPHRMLRDTLAGIRQLQAASFRSIHVDLMIGCTQNLMILARTLKALIEARVDRIVLQWARSADATAVDATPPTERATRRDQEDRTLHAQSVWQLNQAGYINLGMDYFVRPGDPLAVAQTQGRLHTNLDGFSARSDYDVIACGVGAISAIAAIYTKNVDGLEAYYDQIDANTLPIASGIALDMDQALRRTVMQLLMCNLSLSIAAIEQAYPITFAAYFAAELVTLKRFGRDGLLTVDTEWISVSASGRLQIRTICQLFERTSGAVSAMCLIGAQQLDG